MTVTTTVAATLLPDSITKSDTGTTTDEYATGLQWECYGFSNKMLLVGNTGEDDALTYKLLTYAILDGNEYLFEDGSVTEFTVAANTVEKVSLTHAYARVKVQVKSTVSGSATTFQIDAVGNKG